MSRATGRRAARAFAPWGLGTMVVLLACGDTGLGPNTEVPVATVVVNPLTMELDPGDTIRFRAEARSLGGVVLSGRTFTWTSDRPSIVSVDASGLVTARAPGAAKVAAATGDRIGQGSVVVRSLPEPVATVDVEPTEADLLVGDTLRFAAVARSSGGAVLTGRTVTWSSDDPDAVSVSDEGLVTAQGEGVAWISGTVDGVVDSSEVRVTNPAPVISEIEPGTIQAGWSAFTLEVRGERFVSGSRVTWNGTPLETFFVSSTELHATVSASHVAAEGSAQITVSLPAPSTTVSNAMTFTVTSRPALTVDLLIAGNAVFLEDRLRLSAVARDQFGEVIEGKAISWTSSDSTIARIEGEHVRALAVGSVDLVARATPAQSQMRLSVVVAPAQGIIFEKSEAGGEPELFERSLDPVLAARRFFAPGTSGRQAAVSADGQKIAFVGRDGTGQSDIYVVNRDGSGLTRLTDDASISDQPAWSPDGSSLAFRSFRQGKSDIWLMDANGSDQRNLTYASVFVPEEVNERPTWSPDGSTLLFSRGFGITTELYKIGADGTGLAEFVARPGSDLLEATWSPTEAIVAFRRHDRAQGRSTIEFVSSVTGESLLYVAPVPAEARTPVLLGQGWIVMSAQAIPGSDQRTVALLNLQTGHVVVPTSGETGTLAEPAMLPR